MNVKMYFIFENLAKEVYIRQKGVCLLYLWMGCFKIQSIYTTELFPYPILLSCRRAIRISLHYHAPYNVCLTSERGIVIVN